MIGLGPHLHLIQPLDSSGGLLGDSDNLLGHLGPLGGVLGEAVADQAEHDLELRVLGGVGVGQGSILGKGGLGLDSL